MVLAILEILNYPDKRLRQKSKEVVNFDEDLHKFLDSMFETMRFRKGVGLAAIQVNKPLRILLVNVPRESEEEARDEDLYEIINPVFLKQDGEILWEEGCLSVPNFYEQIKRYDEVSIAYKDRFGNDKILQAQGFLSVAIQHEIDHLNGILFVDKLPILRRKKFEKELKRIQKEKEC